MKVSISIVALFLISQSGFSQAVDRVSQLISAENYFAASAKEKGIRKAFLKVSDDHTVIFRPGPVNARDYFEKQPDSTGNLSWQPVFARIAKSGDWGFTSGPFIFKQNDTSKTASYGSYLSVWKKNSKEVWKLAIDLGISHKKPVSTPKLLFSNPKNEVYQRQRSDSRLQQREDIVYSSDQLFATILKADNLIGQTEFLAPDSRLLFPGFEPIVGKAKITEFWKAQDLRMTSRPIKADRSFSGELAYTYGDADFFIKGKPKKFSYVRIWEVQQGYNWNVIFEVYTEIQETKLAVK